MKKLILEKFSPFKLTKRSMKSIKGGITPVGCKTISCDMNDYNLGSVSVDEECPTNSEQLRICKEFYPLTNNTLCG